MTQEIIIVFPFSTMLKRTRMVKLGRICDEMGIVISTWSWHREQEDVKEIDVNFKCQKVLIRGGGYSAKYLKFHYIRWIIAVFYTIITKRASCPIYCLGFETAFPVWMASKVIKVEYIFDDADRFSMIVKLPSLIHRVVCWFERRVSEDSLVNIVPGVDRYEFRNDKQFVLKNTPDSKSLLKSKNIQVERPAASIVIYINGRMSEDRGLPIILSLAKMVLNDSDYAFVAAGYVIGSSAIEFVSLPNVTYIGEVSNAESLAWNSVADFVFTYYDPVLKINRYAESNKWGDCLVLNTPPIVNSEVITAEFLRRSDACVSVPYDDVGQLKEMLECLLEYPEKLSKMKENLTLLSSDVVYFDHGMFDILNKVFNEKTK